jgi:hypothetical protein
LDRLFATEPFLFYGHFSQLHPFSISATMTGFLC